MCRETKVTESELEILKVVWRLNKATTSEIVSELIKKTSRIGRGFNKACKSI